MKKKITECRRSKIAILAILCLTGLGAYTGADIGGIAIAIAGVVASVAGSNAYEKSKTSG
jgi:hypothetical protein